MYKKRAYEETVPLTIFCIVEVIFLFGLIDHLWWGVWAVCLVCVGLYFFALRRILQTNAWKETASLLFTSAFFIFLALLVIYAFCIVGRVAWRGDEFSFWATSVKKMWYLDMFHCVPEAEPYFAEYPPGMQLFQFFLQVLHGAFSEWRISFAYMAYVFALFLPFLKGLRHKQALFNVLVAVTVFSCGTIIYAGALDNLMVDFALSATFALCMALIIAPLTADGGYDWLTSFTILMGANQLILIKSAGKLLAIIVLLAFFISLLLTYKRRSLELLKNCRVAMIPFVITGIMPFVTAELWKVKYTSYQTHISFDTGNYDLKEFFLILLRRVDSGYRSQIRDSFVSFLITEKVQIGFLSLTNLQLAFLLAVVFLLILYAYGRSSTYRAHSCVFYTAFSFLIFYWLGLMASYMYTFSEGEGIALASMQRYLNIYFSALLLMVVFLVLKGGAILKWNSLISAAVLIWLLSLSSWGDIVNMLQRENASYSIAQRAPYAALEEQIRADAQPRIGTAEKDTVLLINRAGYPHIPVNHFTYVLWPDYIVPWECSYGSTLLFDGDYYTQIFSKEELKEHIFALSVDYIAIDYLDDDFIAMYSSLFDAPLQNGQVYKVSTDKELFELLTT